MGKNSHNPRGLSGKAKIKIFVVYFVLFSMLATLACFMVEELIGPTGLATLAVASFVLPALATAIHVRKGIKDSVDDIAKRLP